MFHKNSLQEDKEMWKFFKWNEKINRNSQILDSVWCISRGLLCERQREFCGALLEFTISRRLGEGGDRQIGTNKCSNMTFPPVRGKEKNEHELVSSVYLAKQKVGNLRLSPELFLKFYCSECKITIWELGWVGSLAPSPWCCLTSLSVFLTSSYYCLLEFCSLWLILLIKKEISKC